MAKLKEQYANALLELSYKNNTVEIDLQKSSIVRELLDKPDVQSFLEHTQISYEEKLKLLNNAFSDNVPEHIKGFMDLMVHKNKTFLILPVLNEYIDSINKSMGRIEAIVVSAKALSENQLERIRERLHTQTNMHVEIINRVDADIIGGFYILIDGQIFDGTVRTELNNMKESLMKGSYNDS